MKSMASFTTMKVDAKTKSKEKGERNFIRIEPRSPKTFADWETVLAFSTANLTLTDEDVEELRSERSIKSSKTKEEIERLTVDENLDLFDRTLFLLSSGQDIQKVNAVDNVITLLEETQPETLHRVVPALQEAIRNGSQDLHLASAKMLASIAEKEILPGYLYAKSFLPIILENLNNIKVAISRSWMEALLTVIPFLPSSNLKKEIMDMARSMGMLTRTIQSRLACCKLLGKLAINLDQLSFKKELMSLVTALCQDVEMEVRALMCQELDSVAKGVGLELTRNNILPELQELTQDEEVIVRQAGLDAVTNILPLLDDDSCVDIVVPLVQKYCRRVFDDGNEDEKLTISKHLGRLCHGLAVNLRQDEKGFFLDCFRQLCRCGDPDKNKKVPTSPRGLICINLTGVQIFEDPRAECRRWCAYNFPAMLLFTGVSSFSTELLAVLQQLFRDPHPLVRRTIACGLHEVCKILRAEVGLIQQEVKALLQDSSVEVLQGLVPHLPTVLEVMASEGTSSIAAVHVNMSEFISPLLNCESCLAASSKWRLHSDLLKQFNCLPKCLTSDQIYYKFVPNLFRLLTSNRVLPVRLAAGYTLCDFIKHNRRTDQRQDLCSRLVQDFCKGRSYRLRLLFLEICEYIMQLFSKAFFKENFLDAVLKLVNDPVINVRLKLCSIFPSLKSLIKLPGDRLLLQQLEQCVRQVMALEADRDVSAAIRKAVVEMDRIQLSMDGGLREEDLVDKIKEDQERQLIEEEKKHENLVSGRGQTGSSGSHSAVATRGSVSGSKDQVKRTTKTSKQSKESGINKSSKSDGNISQPNSTGKTTSHRVSINSSNVGRAASFTSGDKKSTSSNHRQSATAKLSVGRTSKASSPSETRSTSKKVGNSHSSIISSQKRS